MPEPGAKRGNSRRLAQPSAPADSSTPSLPKGGGAIRGLGETFAASAFTGTASASLPLPLSSGRSGFGPELSLAYDSGSGNGPFGIGWSLTLPSITRKTERGLPRYADLDESDVFVLSDAEDLVPALVRTGGGWVRDSDTYNQGPDKSFEGIKKI